MRWHSLDFPVVDTHADSLLDVLSERRHLGEDSGAGQLDFPRMAKAGHTLQFFSCWVESDYKPERALWRLLSFIEVFWQEVEANRQSVLAVASRADLAHLVNSDKMGAVLSVEGAEAVGTDPRLVDLLYRLGVRLMSLTWNERNALADGAGEDPGGGGLSQAGRQIVQEMNRIGMVVDVSHLAEAGFWDVLEISTAPVIASHSNCRSLAPHRRNLSDSQIRALARRGGVQGITFVRDFLGGAQDIERVVDHIAHSLEIVGDDLHTGLGSDFDGVPEPVSGLEDVTRLVHLADRMSARGFSDMTIQRVFGSNYVEFFQNGWK